MKNKFVLTEEESKRILSLHKERIKEERNQFNEQEEDLDEEDKGQSTGRIMAGSAAGAGTGAAIGALLTIPLGGAGAIPGSLIGAGVGALAGWMTTSGGYYDKVVGTLKWCNNNRGKIASPVNDDATIRDIADDISAAVEGFGRTDEVMIARSIRKLKSIPDLCRLNDIYRKRNTESLLKALDGDFDQDGEWRDFVWRPIESLYEYSKKKTNENLKKNAQKCGYSSVDEYKKANWKCPKGGGKKQLTDQEKMDKAEKCGYSSWNEYKNSGWKCKTDDGGGGTNTGGGGSNNTGGGGGGQTHPFDYETVSNALKQKFPDEIINPFEQGGEEEIQLDIVTDKIYTEL